MTDGMLEHHLFVQLVECFYVLDLETRFIEVKADKAVFPVFSDDGKIDPVDPQDALRLRQLEGYKVTLDHTAHNLIGSYKFTYDKKYNTVVWRKI